MLTNALMCRPEFLDTLWIFISVPCLSIHLIILDEFHRERKGGTDLGGVIGTCGKILVRVVSTRADL